VKKVSSSQGKRTWPILLHEIRRPGCGFPQSKQRMQWNGMCVKVTKVDVIIIIIILKIQE
jgi:hypothetical protein